MKKERELIILIPVSQSNFWYDHGVSLISAIITLLAFLVTFGTLIYNSRKEKRESIYRSEKTLDLLEFIFEYDHKNFQDSLEKMKYIRKNANKENPEVIGISQNSNVLKKWKENINQDPFRRYIIKLRGLNIDFSQMIKVNMGNNDGFMYLGTNSKKNYIIIQTIGELKGKKIRKALTKYENEIKANLKNQHLNITSDSLGKIYNRIQAIKKSREIHASIEIDDLILMAQYEKIYDEKRITELFGRSPTEIIDEEYEKIVELESELERVIKPLNSGGIK